MCGVAGYVDFSGSPISESLLYSMANEISHRGPDDHGVWSASKVGFAHRRLSILDLTSAASQPMISADKNFTIIFNGLIYNFRALRNELEALGYSFVSQTDTEVLLYTLVHWGVQGISRLNGMFAFAFYDRRKQELILARDRYGIKPLYYSKINHKLYFASEQKAILASSDVSRSVDTEALLEYFTFQNLFTEKTLLKNIYMLPAGHYAVVNTGSKDPNFNLVRYWDFHFREPEREVTYNEYLEELDRLLRQAVQRQVVADVPVGSYLSGGIDSGSLTALAVRHRPGMHTFTCGFDLTSASDLEVGFDERAQARAISDFLGTSYHDAELHAGDMERVMPKLSYHIEEPRVGQSYPNYYAAELARKHVTVVLSGAGGDELFAGYPWRYYRAAASDSFEHYIDLYYKFWHRLIPNSSMPSFFAPIWSEVKHVWTQDIFRSVFKNHDNTLEKPEDYINHSLYFEAKTFLHGLLVVEDKISMAHGLESRVPFLDNDLVDFAMRCPVRYKLNNINKNIRVNENNFIGRNGKFYQKSADGKQILRDVMNGIIPENIRNASKQGFSAPDASWFKGKSAKFLREVILNRNSSIFDFVDYEFVAKKVDCHISGRENNRLLIWSLLSFDAFLNSYIR